MNNKILEKLYISNYHIGNNLEFEGYLSKFGGGGFHNEVMKHDIFGSFFNFLVYFEEKGVKTIGRVVLKLNNFSQIKYINEAITLANKRFYFLDENSEIQKHIKVNGYVVGILLKEDLEKIEQQGIEIYQANMNLFQSLDSEAMQIYQSKYKKIIFLNEYLFSLIYFGRIKDIFDKKDLKKTTKIYKTINGENLIYESIINNEMEYLLKENDLIFMNSCFFGCKDENKDIVFYSYFQKLAGYFKYFDDFGKIIQEEEKKKIYGALFLLSSLIFEQNENVFDFLLKNCCKTIKNNSIKIIEEKINTSSIKTLDEFFYGSNIENKELIKYKQDMHKPLYGLPGLDNFLFKK